MVRNPWMFWSEALRLRESVAPRLMLNVLAFGLFSLAVYEVDCYEHIDIRVPVGPYEVAGVLLGLLLVMRTNAGYDRWWEARKAWGGIVNQSRNLAVAGLVYGPPDPDWKDRFARWTAAFPHAARSSLRDRRDVPELTCLLGPEEAESVTSAQHMPTYVAARLALLLEEADLDRFAFLQADRERAMLIDHLGVCERIKGTPLAQPFSILIRQFILLFLLTLPFALLHKFAEAADPLLVPLVMMMVAYAILGLDQIGVELQSPFDPMRLGHLPLDAICQTIETNVLALVSTTHGPLDAPMSARLK
ncbi:MAG TPA: bestrophin family ion channel [Isosphaeraceae bacterium]|nr:bestrophin family ion channel [Isosphaeraceae bacterium]